MAKILVVEDDRQLSNLIVDWLKGEGHLPEAVVKGTDGLEYLRSFKFDLVILDWDLPGLSGLDVCREFRNEGGKTPILMLTGKTHIDEKAVGLDSGADDYLTKPFHFKELGARLRALLRRPAAVQTSILAAGWLTLDPAAHQVQSHRKDLSLQPKEFALLEFFMRHPNQPFSSEAIIERVWASDTDAAPDTVRIQIMRLRSKIDESGKESMIRTIHRVGYMFVPPADGAD
jgi:DNA-binding response OmpR family regulator